MGYTKTTRFDLKKPTYNTPDTEWDGYLEENFDTIDAMLTKLVICDDGVIVCDDGVVINP